jgi:hypothetical protein
MEEEEENGRKLTFLEKGDFNKKSKFLNVRQRKNLR